MLKKIVREVLIAVILAAVGTVTVNAMAADFPAEVRSGIVAGYPHR